VMFTRDPATGEPYRMGDWLVNAQGEDVVAGIRPTLPLEKMDYWNPTVYGKLLDFAGTLELHYQDMQDMEFTVQSGKLYILQTRNGKRAAQAAFRIAHDLVAEGVIDKKTALSRVTQQDYFAASLDRIDPAFKSKPGLKGLGAGGGVVTGVAVFTTNDAVNCKEPCILIRHETSPDDIAGINKAVGILTATGGLTSHAAVVARGMNKTCVVGATELVIQNESIGAVTDGTKHLFNITPGMKLTLNGVTGEVWVGTDVPIIKGSLSKEALQVVEWAREEKKTIERVAVHRNMPACDVLSAIKNAKGEKVYIDTAGFEAEELLELGKVLSQVDKQFIVDLKSLRDFTPNHNYLAMVFSPLKETEEDRVTALSYWPEKVKGVTTVLCSSEVASNLDLDDFNRVICPCNVHNFADLLAASGPVKMVNPAAFGSQAAFEEAVKLVEAKKGVSLSMPVAMYSHQLLDSLYKEA
jgi:phosphohistidine swiveling domain-containing protein